MQLFYKRLIRDLKAHRMQVIILLLILGLGGGAWFGIREAIQWNLDSCHAFYSQQNLDDGIIYFYDSNGIQESVLESELTNTGYKSTLQKYDSRLRLSVGFLYNSTERTQIAKGYIYGVKNATFENNSLNIPYIISGETKMGEIIIDHNFVKANNMILTDGIRLRIGMLNIPLNISGTAISPEWLSAVDPESMTLSFGNSFLISYMHLESLQQLVGKLNVVNELMFKVNPGENIKEVGDLLKIYFEERGYKVKLMIRSEQSSYKLIEEDAQNDKKTFSTMAIIAFLISLFGLWISINRLIISQRRTIGIDLSLGVSGPKILTYYMAYGLFIGILSIGSTIITGFLISEMFWDVYQTFYNVPIDARTLNITPALEGAGIGLICSLLASWYPARQASQLSPIKAMRQDPALSPTTMFRAKEINQTKKLKVSNKSNRLFDIKMAARNIIRNRKRSIATIASVAVSIGLVISISTIFLSMDNVVQEVAAESGNWNYHIALGRPVQSGYVNNLFNREEVDSYYFGLSTMVAHQLNHSSDSDEEEVMMIIGFSNLSGMDLKISQGDFDNNGSSLIVSEDYAKKHNISIGDFMLFEHPIFNIAGYSIINSSLKVSGFHQRTARIEILCSWNLIHNFLNLTTEINQVYLTVKEDRISDFQKATYDYVLITISESKLQNLYDTTKVFDNFKDVFNVFKFICYGLGLGVIYITSSITRKERVRETGTLATIGASDFKIFKLGSYENIILVAFGILFGYGVGYGIQEYIMMPAFNEVLSAFIIKTYIPLSLFINVSIIVLIFSIFTQFPIFIELKKMDLSQATKVRDF